MLAEGKGEPWGIVRKMLGCDAMSRRTEMVERGFQASQPTMIKPRVRERWSIDDCAAAEPWRFAPGGRRGVPGEEKNSASSVIAANLGDYSSPRSTI